MILLYLATWTLAVDHRRDLGIGVDPHETGAKLVPLWVN